MAGKDVDTITDISEEVRLTFIRGLRENKQLAAKLNLHDVTGETVSQVRNRLGSNPARLDGNEELKLAIQKVVTIVLKSCSKTGNRTSVISSSSGISSLRASGSGAHCTDERTDQGVLSQLPPDVEALVERQGTAALTSRRSVRDPNRARRQVDQLDCVAEEQGVHEEKPQT